MFILSEQNTIANHFIAEIRDKNIQQDRVRFRKNITRLGSMLAYEISKKLEYQKKTISTPLGESIISLPTQVPVVATILRAGLPFFQGFLEIFEQADTAFIGAKRNHQIDGSENDISINVDYLSAPSLDKKILIITDPMLATGQSMVRVLEMLHQIGTPSTIYIATVIASEVGVDFVKKNYPTVSIWTAALDTELNSNFYIVPGLGDAGDLAYGEKL